MYKMYWIKCGEGGRGRMKTKPIKMSFPPKFVADYVHKWAKKAKSEAANDAEKAILDDIVTMVDVALSNMQPVNAN